MVKKVLFVLGSGVSSFICSRVEDITKKVLDPSGLQLPSFHSRHDEYEIIRVIKGFLGELDKTARQLPIEPTYEDLFSMCKQLYDWETGINTDPALTQFRDHIYRNTAQFWKFFDGGHYLGRKPLAAVARKSSILINEVIRVLLSQDLQKREIADLNQELKLLIDTIEKYGAENVDVLTLNHDTLVEKLLGDEVPWTTGFDSSISKDGDVINFSPDSFQDKTRVRIVKLHGSIDWYYVGTNQSNFRWVSMCWEQYQQLTFEKVLDWNGKNFYEDHETVSELTGTTTKTSSYTEGIHGELYIQARQLLKEHNRIICSGYGWRDYGVNSMLREWAKSYYTGVNKHLLLLHADKIDALNKPWFWPKDWDSQKRTDWFQWHPNWLSETKVSEIDDIFWNM